MNVNVLLNKEKVQRAFQFFDKDGSGSIDAEEIKEVLGLTNNQNLNKEITTIVAQVDKNGDGKLDFKEFERMLVQAQSNEE
jgi:Ca2+-binding EF-hand superfamily protein